MSTNQWEHGEITLPASAVGPLKAALRDTQNMIHDRVRTEVVAAHRAAGTRSLVKYRAYLRSRELAAQRNRPVPSRQFDRQKYDVDLLVNALTSEILERMVFTAVRSGKPLRQPTVADVCAVIPKATTATSTFDVLSVSGWGAASILFDGRTVTWDVPANNYAVDVAAASPTAHVFFTHLDTVRWTDGTGGTGTGNDENNSREGAATGGANYQTFSYGPVR